jgi:diacylglycerol kinase family enzyme
MSALIALSRQDASATLSRGSENAPDRDALGDQQAQGFAAVINVDAGALSGIKRRRIAETLRSDVLGEGVRIFYADGAGLVDTLLAAAETRPKAVLVCGGDGTARTAIETLTPLGVASAPLPGGTLNRLVHTVYGEARLHSILARIVSGGARWIPAGVVGGHRFYAVSGYGAAMRLNAAREHVRALRWGKAISALAAHSKRIFDEPLALGDDRTAVTCAIIGLGPVDAAFGLARPARRDEFEIAAATLRGFGDGLKLAGRVAIKRWRKSPDVSVLNARSVLLEAPGDTLFALLDGEPFELPKQVKISYQERAGLVWR